MSHYIKLFIAFTVTNYLLIFIYDNYYLIHVENSYIIDTRDELRQLTLDLRSRLTNNESDSLTTINQWALEKNIPSQVLALDQLKVDSIAKSQLVESDYIIDIYYVNGPSSFLKLSDSEVVEIGPLDPLVMDSTSYQPFFIILILLVNGIATFWAYWRFQVRNRKLESAIVDVVERRALPKEVLAEQDVLRNLANRLLEVDSYIEEIEESNHQIINDQRDLMHAVAHELRSPIARFSFALELVEDNDKSPEDRKLIKEMHDSIDELESLIKEILSYSRLSHGKMVMNYGAIDLVEIVTIITARLQTLYTQQEFHIIKDENCIEIYADPKLLERALINLLRNAARFAKQRVNVTISCDKDNVSICVDDDGMGIPPGKRERIFEAFTRLDPSRSRDSGGVGLGLAIVKKVVEKHNGKVAVSDSPMGGARFIVSLPNVEDLSIE
ncbi:MAG: ATP-binding protein [Kangiellaceae bacterium]|nr:ATP-binding protein [Kangiellaceae bacterium]